MNDVLTSLNRWIGNRLPMRQTIWLKRLRREEHPWQRTQRVLRERERGLSTKPTILSIKAGPATVIERGYDSMQSVAYNVAETSEVLRSQGVDFVRLPDLTPFNPILVIKLEDLHATLSAVASLREADGWSLRIENAKRRSIGRSTALSRPESVFRVVISRHIIGTSGHLMSTPGESVVIEPWETVGSGVERVDGSTYLEGTMRRRLSNRGPYVEYVSPELWQHATNDEEQLIGWPAPHLYQVTEPIDLVYTWVDGDDPKWQARKAHASALINPEAVNETALSDSRFTSRDELKYSLRSVEAYANWVNHIYIVTDQQVPEWLNTDHPKITVVDHREIFADPSVLPVFNSHAIESQLHRIPGLNERYLYMNDDLFFMKPVRPELFFTSSGLSKFFPSRAPLDIHDATARDLPVLSAAKHGREFMITHHGRTVTNKFKHTPHPQLRSVLEQMEAEHPGLFRTVASSPFRAPEDYSIASSLSHFYAYANRTAVPGDIAYDYIDIGNARAALRLEWFTFQERLEVICLNDTHLDAAEQHRVSQLLSNFLERRFSIVSTFER